MDAEIFREIVRKEADRIFGKRKMQVNNFVPSPETDGKNEFSVVDFLYIPSDEEFLTKAYQGILKRPPDPDGFQHYMKCLREERYGREGVLYALRYSPEGKQKGVRIKNLKLAAVIARLSMLPIVGGLFKALRTACFFSPEALRKVISQERVLIYNEINSVKERASEITNSYQSLERILERILEQKREVDSRLKEIEGEFDLVKEKIEDIERNVSSEMKGLYEQVRKYNASLRFLADELVTKFWHDKAECSQDVVSEDEKLQSFYALFEDRFRGSRAAVRSGFFLYIPYVKEARPSKEYPVIDVGSGRGEWISLLRENGIPAVGIEINPFFVKFCKGMGMEVLEQDIFDFLNNREDNSISAFTAFHFIEHLSFDALLRFLREVYRCLRPSGVLIMETPNPRNILVGSGDFFRDPSHVRPIFPDTLETLCESIGFQMGRSFFFDNSREHLIEVQTVRFDSLEDYVKVSRDYAWIGYKI